MNTDDRRSTRRRALRLYALGQAVIVFGAGAMTWTHSYAPMALAASAGLLLTVPLVRDLMTPRLARARTRR